MVIQLRNHVFKYHINIDIIRIDLPKHIRYENHVDCDLNIFLQFFLFVNISYFCIVPSVRKLYPTDTIKEGYVCDSIILINNVNILTKMQKKYYLKQM